MPRYGTLDLLVIPLVMKKSIQKKLFSNNLSNMVYPLVWNYIETSLKEEGWMDDRHIAYPFKGAMLTGKLGGVDCLYTVFWPSDMETA